MLDTPRIVFNARVLTMAPGVSSTRTGPDAIGWRGGAIVAVGARAEVEAALRPGAELHDAGGATVVPGFVDAHHHASIHALYGGALRLAPPEVTDIESLQRALSRAARGLGPGDWLVGTGWDELCLAERRSPTRAELDDAVPDRPLFALHYSCHRAVANSRALEAAGIGRDTPSPRGGRISRGAGGLPDGLLVERGLSQVESLARAALVARDAEGFIARLASHHRELVAKGITYVCDATVPAEIGALYREAARRGALIVPTSMLPVSSLGYFEPPWDVLEGPLPGEPEGLLSIGPVKLIFDGAPGCAMCLTWWQAGASLVRAWMGALRDRSLDPIRAPLSVEPRLGPRAAGVRTGIAIYRRDEAASIVRAAVDRGFGVAVHAIGNDAVDVALAAFEDNASALARLGASPRVEHAVFLDRGLVARLACAGVAVVTQPHFLTLPAMGGAPSIPALPTMPLRWLLDAGVTLAGSSDFPVAGFDPLDGVRSAVSRRTARGRPREPDQAATMDEALAMYTRAAAYACGFAKSRGTLAPGKRADVVVLDRAVLSLADLDAARVRATVLGGEVVYGAIGA